MGRLGIAAIGRPTFDLDFAAQRTAGCIGVLEGLAGWDLVGSPEIAFDDAGLAATIGAIGTTDVEAVVVIQSTFADSTFVQAIAAATGNAKAAVGLARSARAKAPLATAGRRSK